MNTVLQVIKVLSTCLILAYGNFWPISSAEASVSLNLFYEALEPYGRWFDHRLYGQVWQPYKVSKKWRPYTEGHWIYTARYGWYWQSDWEWGWAPFHYGRWAYDSLVGWLWIPGTVWAPAWVSWQYTNGYSAWAPLPPEIYWQPGSGLSFSYYSANRIPDNYWCVVPQQQLTHRHINRVILPPRQNSRYINSTNSTYSNISLNQNQIFNAGIPVKQLEQNHRLQVQPLSGQQTDALIAHQFRTANGLTVIAPATQPTNPSAAEYERELAFRIMRETQQNQHDMHGRPTTNHEPTPNAFKYPMDAAAPLSAPTFTAPSRHEQTIPQHQAEWQRQQAQQVEQQRQQEIQRQQLEQQRQLEWQQQQAQQLEIQRQAERQQREMEVRQQQLEEQRQAEWQQQQVQQMHLQREAEQQQQVEIQRQQALQIEMQQQAQRQRQMEIQQQQLEQQRQAEIQRQQAQQVEMQQQAERQRQMEIQQRQLEQQQQVELQRQQAQQVEMQQQAERQRQMEIQQQAEQQRQMQQQAAQQQMLIQQQTQQEQEKLKRMRELQGPQH